MRRRHARTSFCDDSGVSGQGSADWRAQKRTDIERVFAAARRGGSERYLSPSGRYELEVVDWQVDGGWDYSEGVVRRTHDGRSITSIRRNYAAFPFLWCEGHPAGHDYLLAGEDYQGQTVVELDTGRRVDHLPGPAEQGNGFCWAEHHLSPDRTVLVVDGCYWACPYELVAFDFSRPMDLPYAELHRWPGDLRTVDGFDDSGELSWTFDVEVRLSDGKPSSELTDDEESALLDERGHYLPGALGTASYRGHWRLGQPFSSTRTEPVEGPGA